MNSRFLLSMVLSLLLMESVSSQNYTFDYDANGQRVCLLSTEIDLEQPSVRIFFLDSLDNTDEASTINRRVFGTYAWNTIATDIAPGTGHWVDQEVNVGEVYEYQVRRQNTWNYQSDDYDAIGYTMGAVLKDNTYYKGQMILLVAQDVPENLPEKYFRLKKELTADGWYVNEIQVARAADWDSGEEVVFIREQIVEVYNNADANDKPKILFILGHVALPRSGSDDVTSPDEHDENQGARGCEAYFADMDGIFTDEATFESEDLSTTLAINLPGDFKWDQDFFPSDIEMAFGRVDFADITDVELSEFTMMENYLDKLSDYKNVVEGWDMGDKSGFYHGYDNSNDGTYRSLFNISLPADVYQNYTGDNHNEWVQNNGPFKIYMQNKSSPGITNWETYGMDATVFSSDQSWWGFGDVPQPSGAFSRIRALLGVENTKCLVALWTTAGINIFHSACAGIPFGMSFKDIMNHNANNQYLEKAPQQYDTEEWWNRTHFAFYGDPTLNLYQVSPPTDPQINDDGSALFSWTLSTEPDVLGYHVYESDSELGEYQRISSDIITGNSYYITDYQQGHWYMVKAVSRVVSGCGQFLQTSIGKAVEGSIALSASALSDMNSIKVYPNPVEDFLRIESEDLITNYAVYDMFGQQMFSDAVMNQSDLSIDVSHLSPNVYVITVVDVNMKRKSLKFIKR